MYASGVKVNMTAGLKTPPKKSRFQTRLLQATQTQHLNWANKVKRLWSKPDCQTTRSNFWKKEVNERRQRASDIKQNYTDGYTQTLCTRTHTHHHASNAHSWNF